MPPVCRFQVNTGHLHWQKQLFAHALSEPRWASFPGHHRGPWGRFAMGWVGRGLVPFPLLVAWWGICIIFSDAWSHVLRRSVWLCCERGT